MSNYFYYKLDQSQVDAYLSEVIDYDQLESTVTERFMSEYGYNLNRMNLTKCCMHFLQGLPSWINHEFFDVDILLDDRLYNLTPDQIYQLDCYADLIDRYWLKMGVALSKLIKAGV